MQEREGAHIQMKHDRLQVNSINGPFLFWGTLLPFPFSPSLPLFPSLSPLPFLFNPSSTFPAPLAYL